MSVTVSLSKRNRIGAHSFSFPAISAGLDLELVKELKMGPAIRRFGLALIAQMKEAGRPVIGVELHSISFTMIYK